MLHVVHLVLTAITFNRLLTCQQVRNLCASNKWTRFSNGILIKQASANPVRYLSIPPRWGVFLISWRVPVQCALQTFWANENTRICPLRQINWTPIRTVAHTSITTASVPISLLSDRLIGVFWFHWTKMFSLPVTVSLCTFKFFANLVNSAGRSGPDPNRITDTDSAGRHSKLMIASHKHDQRPHCDPIGTPHKHRNYTTTKKHFQFLFAILCFVFLSRAVEIRLMKNATEKHELYATLLCFAEHRTALKSKVYLYSLALCRAIYTYALRGGKQMVRRTVALQWKQSNAVVDLCSDLRCTNGFH